MGIANTTASAALIAVFTGADAGQVTGRGTGVDPDVGTEGRRGAPRAGVARCGSGRSARRRWRRSAGSSTPRSPGSSSAGPRHRVPVVLDGVIACAAALAARAFAPDVTGCLIAGHLSTEPGARRALDSLGLRPLLDLGLRLGEGSGAVLALPIVAAAARVLRDIATFDSAGVSGEKA